MDLSRPDRSERLDRLAAEFALGTLPPRPRSRLAQAARTQPTVAAAIGEWEQRLAALAAAIPAVTPPPRVWTVIVSRLGLSAAPAGAAGDNWWNRLGVWRALTAFAFAAVLGLGIALVSQRAAIPEASLVAVLAGADGKPALIASARRNDAFLLVKAVGAAPVEAGKALELWMLPTGAAPRSLGLIPATGIARVPLPARTDSALANIPALAVSLEPASGSPTGLPTGPVLYSGPIERMY
jgi:anti-sigma-K factor RskA